MSISTSARRFEQRKATLIQHLRAATDATSRRLGYDATLDDDGLYWHSIDGRDTLRRARSRRSVDPQP